MSARPKEHGFASIIADYGHRNLLQYRWQGAALAQATPSGDCEKEKTFRLLQIYSLSHHLEFCSSFFNIPVAFWPIRRSSVPGKQIGAICGANSNGASNFTSAKSYSYVKKLYFGWTIFFETARSIYGNCSWICEKSYSPTRIRICDVSKLKINTPNWISYASWKSIDWCVITHQRSGRPSQSNSHWWRLRHIDACWKSQRTMFDVLTLATAIDRTVHFYRPRSAFLVYWPSLAGRTL